MLDAIRELLFGPDDPTKIIECSANSTCEITHAIVGALVVFVILLTGFAYTTVLERRLIASIQSRVGPNRAGPQGLLQPVADGIKLIFKEDLTPNRADRFVFYLAPLLKVIPALLVLAVVPLGPKLLIPWFDGNWYRVSQGLIDVNVGVLYLLAVTSVSVYGSSLAGWASNNKYAMLGGLRASAAMISYELSMGILFAVPVLLAASMSLGDIIGEQRGFFNWYVWHNPLAAVLLGVALIAEINRGPFDMPEAEQELVAGHMTEYSGMKFAMFFMAEYINMIGVSVIFCALFLGGYDDGLGLVSGAPILGVPVLALKVIVLLAIMVWIRATVFRLRYDRLMSFGWKIMLPLSLIAVAWTAVAITIAEEGGGDTAYLISSIVLLVIVAGVGYMLSRTAGPLTPPDPGQTTMVPSGATSIGAVLLQFVGVIFAIPFMIYETVTGGSREQSIEDKAKS
ncbi:MAG: NADH-quinone oxidoreductase subunit NuoH [Chloroflexi bacterium]|nr:NADH-quinone oxidoreductase subunit NuoH [Chloroflexota bacterium]